MSNIVINVENLSKSYRLGIINHGMLYKDLQSWWARTRGKEDPNTRVDVHGGKRDIDAAGHFWALKDVSFSMDEGDVLGIIGKNGAGKSTLLKILSRVTAPTKGTVKVKGRIASLLEVGTGFHPELTGRENIYLNGAILGMTRKEVDRKFDEIVSFSEIDDFIDTPVKRYSSGMYVRLAFAVAAHLEPEILIIDEVLAVGDASFQKKCLGKMGEVSKQGRTVLFVSHNLTAIRNLCPKTLLLSSGKAVKLGDTSSIINKYLIDNQKGYNIFNPIGNERIGDRMVSIEDFKIQPNPPVTGGSVKFIFSLFVKNKKPVTGIELAIAVSTSDKMPIFQVFSGHMSKDFMFPPGRSKVIVKIDYLPLMTGVYSCNLWLGKGRAPVDWIKECVLLKVESGKTKKEFIENRGYPIIIKSKWKQTVD